MKQLIIFLIRKRLGLKQGEEFRFANQKSEYDYYYFTKDCLIKMCFVPFVEGWQSNQSTCSLNWLLNDECEIVRLKDWGKVK